MRRTILLLSAMALAVALVSGVAWAANLIGTDGPDTITGTHYNDALQGKGGNDVISGLAAKKTYTAPALDVIYGGDGDDTLYGGTETLGYADANHVYGENGNDLIVGGDGIDGLQGGPGNDTILDSVEDDAAADSIYGGDGDDDIGAASSPASKDIVECGGGTDVVEADALDQVANDCETVHELLNEQEALARDASQYAADYGVSVTEATRRLELQDNIGELRSELEANESATFADLYATHGSDYGVVALFTAGGEQTIQSYVEGTPLESVVETRPAEATLTELEAAQDQAMSDYESQGVTVESDINVVENRAEIYVTDEVQAQFESTQPSQADSVQQAQNAQLPEHVVVITVDALSIPAANFYGGLATNVCTSGFSVRLSNGDEGMVTAAHCEDNVTYRGTRLPFVKQSRRDNYDVQLHRTPNYDDRAWFLDRNGSGSDIREVLSTRGRANQSVGDYVCKSGMTTGYTCGTIVGRSFTPTGYLNSPDGTYIRVDSGGRTIVGRGDSGGSIFNGNTALGLVSGRFNSDLIYMAINYVHESDLGVSHIQKAN